MKFVHSRPLEHSHGISYHLEKCDLMPWRRSTQFQFALAAVRSGIPIIGEAMVPYDELAKALAFGGGGGGAGGKFAKTSSFSREFDAASSTAGVAGAVGGALKASASRRLRGGGRGLPRARSCGDVCREGRRVRRRPGVSSELLRGESVVCGVAGAPNPHPAGML